MHSKFAKLKTYLNQMNEQGICLAFSGGVDSALLLYLCKDLNLTAVTFKSIFQTDEEICLARNLCKKYGVKQIIKEFSPLKNPILKNNPKDRCYHCKKMLFQELKAFASEKYVIDGTNFDDLSVYRPGLKALKELNIISPFAEFEIKKSEIRAYAKELGIEIFDKPSTPCLATRFPYGIELERKLIKIVDKAENILKQNGFDNCRCRLHGQIVRIEIPQNDFSKFIKISGSITSKLKKLGLKYITLDVEGLRSGSMDE